MLDAWRGPSEARLAGFLSYDLAAELEDWRPFPPENFSFPKFYFGLYDAALIFEGERWSHAGTDAWRTLDIVAQASACECRRSQFRLSSGPVSSRPDRAAFEAAVERTV